jgi:4a-hydroxytetrahydrobiopterin dehydratase
MTSASDLTRKHCQACEGGVPKLTPAQVGDLLEAVPGWALSADGGKIARTWKAADFVSAMAFLNRAGDLAEAEQHHPDLHLTGYRKVAIEIWTHAVGGLTENDFILAAKIDALDPPAGK